MISVLTISFNQIDYLPRCVESVASQVGADFEHIIVDPGSTDGSREWLRARVEPRISLLFEPDDGPAQGLNHALERASGDIVMYLNSDDVLAPGALSAVARLHGEHPGADVILGNGWTVGADEEPIAYVRSDRFSPLRYAFKVGTVLQQASSYKRRLFESGLRFNEANRYSWDAELLFDAHRAGATFLNVKDCIGYFRLQPASITMSGAHEEGLARDRQRLFLRGRPAWLTVPVEAASYAARAIKRARNVVLDLIERPAFPGAARAGERQ